MSEKSLRAKAISGLRLGVRGSPALRRPLGTTGMGNGAQIDAKGGNWVYNTDRLAIQKGNPSQKERELCRL